jgi:hypothetical protein
MLCESQPPVSCAGAKAHSLSARALLLLDALGTVARYATAPIASSLISHALSTVARYATAPIASSLISLALGTVALNNRTHRLI